MKEMGIPEHLTCLLRNLCAGQEPRVRTGHGTTTNEWIHVKMNNKNRKYYKILLNAYAV